MEIDEVNGAFSCNGTMNEVMDAEKVGKAIQFLRRRAGYTQLELAERLLVSDKAVSRWERGKGIPDVSLLRRLSIILDTDIDSLLEGSVAIHEESWKGLLYADFPVDSVIYDKPLADYLLSYFLLARVRDIIIFASSNQTCFLRERFGDGERLNINLSYFEIDQEMPSAALGAHSEFFANSNVMVLYGPCVLYGVNLTRFLRRGMLNEGKISALLTVRNDSESEVFMNDEKRIVKKEENHIITKYHYCRLPFMYSHGGIKKLRGNYDSFDDLFLQLTEKKQLHAELLDKGFVDFEISNNEDILNASNFISIVQKQTGTKVCDPEEVAMRRGLIEEQ